MKLPQIETSFFSVQASTMQIALISIGAIVFLSGLICIATGASNSSFKVFSYFAVLCVCIVAFVALPILAYGLVAILALAILAKIVANLNSSSVQKQAIRSSENMHIASLRASLVAGQYQQGARETLLTVANIHQTSSSSLAKLTANQKRTIVLALASGANLSGNYLLDQRGKFLAELTEPEQEYCQEAEEAMRVRGYLN